MKKFYWDDSPKLRIKCFSKNFKNEISSKKGPEFHFFEKIQKRRFVEFLKSDNFKRVFIWNPETVLEIRYFHHQGLELWCWKPQDREKLMNFYPSYLKNK